jgi:anti-sigma factor RsiW
MSKRSLNVNCNGARGLLHAYLDGELDLVRHLEVEHHVQECAACAEEHDRQRSLRQAIVADAPYYRAPAGLRERLRGKSEGQPVPVVRTRRWLIRLAAAASIALLAWALGRYGPRLTTDDHLADEVVASHVRSRLGDHLFDVASSDQHVLKPWLTRNLDFAPAVFDLVGDGFPLAGGRLDYLNGRPAAALVYHRREHVINLFVAPSSGAATAPRTLTRRGFYLVHWSGAGMSHWAVSDLNERELMEFVRLLQQRENGSAESE